MTDFLTPYKIYLNIILAILICGVIVFLSYRFVEYEQTIGYNRAKVEFSKKENDLIQAQLDQSNQALKRENELQEKLAKAENERVKREQIIKITNDKLNITTSSLRDAISKYNSVNVSTDTEAAANQRAVAASQLLGECTERYSELAKKADGHIDDIKTLTESYPSTSQ